MEYKLYKKVSEVGTDGYAYIPMEYITWYQPCRYMDKDCIILHLSNGETVTVINNGDFNTTLDAMKEDRKNSQLDLFGEEVKP